MTQKPANTVREINHKNGVVEIWVSRQPKNKMHTGSYNCLWGYLFNGVKYSSKKKADAAVNQVND